MAILACKWTVGALMRDAAANSQRPTFAAGLIVLAAVLVACGGTQRPVASGRQEATASRRILPGQASASSCAREARAGVRRFVARVDAGDAAGADALVVRHGFVWFVLGVRTAGGRVPPVAANRVVEIRSGLLGYLRRRIAVRERLVLRTLTVQAPEQGQAGVALVLRRRARDIDHARWTRMVAKAAWSCSQRRLTGLAGHSVIIVR